MAPIIADNDIPELIKNSIDSELTDRGFKLGDGKVLVVAELQNFRNHFQVGFFSGTATADLAMNVKVAGPDRQIIYDEHFIAQGVNPGIQLSTGDNARIALDAALQDAMTKLFNDPKFLSAITSADAAASART
jgi:uncharacterized lipoprotein